MSRYTILQLMILVLMWTRAVSTQHTTTITIDHSEVEMFGITDKSSENTTSNDTITDAAISETGNSSYVDPNSIEQIFRKVKAHIMRYYVFSVNILSFCCCILTIVVLQRGALKSSSTVYVRGSAVSSIFGILLYIVYSVRYHESVSQSRAFQNFYSYIVAYGDVFLYISMMANSWIILAFALERLFAICLPLKSRVFNNESRAKKIVAVIFLVAVLMNIPRFLRITVTITVDRQTNDTLHVWSYTPFGRDPVIRKAIYISYAVVVIIIPMPILAVLNLLIIIKLRSVKRKQLQLREGDAKATGNSGDKKQVQMERVLVASLLAFLLCYTPIASTTLTVAFVGTSIFRTFNLGIQLLFLVSPIFYVSNGCLNFLLYVLCSKILRDAVKDLFCGKCAHNKASSGKEEDASKNTQRSEAENSMSVDNNSAP